MTEGIHLDFLKARFDYCKEIHYKLMEDKEKLENKVKLIMSLITIFLSAIILNITKIKEIKEVIFNEDSVIINSIILIISLLAVLIYFSSIVCIFMSFRIRSFDEIYPEKFSEKFLFKGTQYFLNEDNEKVRLTDKNILNNFYYTMTLVITNSVEKNSKLLNNKAKWFDYSWQLLLIIIFLMYIDLALIFYN